LFGKRTFLSQDGVDWKRAKWPWYARLYLRFTAYLTAYAPNAVIFDNVFCKRDFENRFKRDYDFIPFGSEVSDTDLDESVFEELGLKKGEYFLFVGRFIPDKGLHYLIPAFEKTLTDKKLVLVGGPPNPSRYEQELSATKDPRILMPGFLYGRKTHALMKHAYAYIQPSDIEGLSPVILEAMGLGAPIICSDIQENQYVVGETGTLFKQGNIDHLAQVLRWTLDNPEAFAERGRLGQKRAQDEFSWDSVAVAHEKLFNGDPHSAPPEETDPDDSLLMPDTLIRQRQ
ncbi:MAG: glycosyltransferase, partial [Burkholderiaceae bacterium]